MKIALIGDIALFGKNTVKTGEYESRFAEIKKVLDQCDYVIGNLESPLTNYDRVVGGKSAYLKGSPEDVAILEYLGITHVSLANNHAFDYCQKGLDDTIHTLDTHNIYWYGINGKNCIIESDDSKVQLMGYCCYSTNGKGMGTINILDPRQIEIDISNIDNNLPILSLHWGQEHVHLPNYDHIEVARKLCKGKQIIIHGHHPHVIQGIENIGDSLVAYSLGNFCFDDVYTNKSREPLIKLSEDNQESFVLIIEIQRNQILKYDIVPFSFVSGQYILKESINEKISLWSQKLKIDKEEFIAIRLEKITDYLSARKATRDFSWYLKRMNLESVRMILAARENALKYNSLIKEYIA